MSSITLRSSRTATPSQRRPALHAAAIVAIALAGTSLAGCDKATPSGQVVARVNGEEITTRDLSTEVASAQLPPGTDVTKLTPLVLAKVVDRKLVAAEGRRLGLDKTPDYLSASQRADEVLLGEQTLRRWNQDATAPSAAAVQSYIASHESMFANRALFSVVQLRIPSDKVDVQDLIPLKTLAEVQTFLDGRGIAPQVGRVVADSAQIAPQVAAQLRKATNGEPLVERQGDTLLISAVVGARNAPMPVADQRKLAGEQIKRDELMRRITTLRSSAKIDYQKGYSAPATGPDAAATGAAAAK